MNVCLKERKNIKDGVHVAVSVDQTYAFPSDSEVPRDRLRFSSDEEFASEIKSRFDERSKPTRRSPIGWKSYG